MEIFQLQILAIACFTAIACVLPGVFLVLRGVALMSDAISHAILLCFSVMFLFVQRLESPLLILGRSEQSKQYLQRKNLRSRIAHFRCYFLTPFDMMQFYIDLRQRSKMRSN